MDRIPGEALLEEAGEDGEEGVEVVAAVGGEEVVVEVVDGEEEVVVVVAAVDGEEVVVVVDGEEGVEDGEVDHGEEDPEEVGEVEQETIPTERREVSFRHKQCFFCKKPLVELYFSFSIEKKTR